MKKINAVCLLFLTSMMSFPAFSISPSEAVGTWFWSGIACRDANLNANSHRTLADGVENPDRISEATLVLGSDNSVKFSFTQDGRDQSYNGSFEITDNGSKVVLRGNEGGEFPLYVVDNNSWLVVRQCESDYERDRNVEGIDQDEITQKIEVLRSACGNNQCFVYLLGKE